MSGICGIVRFDRAPVLRDELERMAGAAAHRGPHGTFVHCDGPVGLVYQSLEITPESVGERQPVRGAGGAFLLADARLDNRAELAAAAGVPDRAGAPLTDAEILLAALTSDPEHGPRRVLGDFAWALWDPRAGELRLARDAMGMRALYFRVEPHRVLFATEVKQILAADGVPRRLNELAVAWYLSGMQAPADQVFFAGIDSVVPAEEVVVGRGGRLRRRIFWRPDSRYRIRYRDEGEYAEQLRSLLIDAMSARLRVCGPVGVSLSGGLDSGTAASLAGWLREREAPGAPSGGWPELRAYTLTFTELSQCDERENVYRIAARYGFPVREFAAEKLWPLVGYPDHGCDEDDPFISMFQPFINSVADAAAEEGVRVLFQGTRGDLMFGGTVFDVHGLVRSGRLAQARRQLGLLRRYYGDSRLVTLARYLIGPGLSPLVHPALRRPRGQPFARAESHVSRSFLLRAGLPDRDPLERDSEPWWDEASRERYRHIFTPLVMRAVLFLDRLAAVRGVGFADPWSDRRIAEFALACPQHILHRVGDSKRLARRAVDGILPQAQKAAKVPPAPLYHQALRTHARATVLDLITNSRAAALGFIDEQTLRTSYESYLAGSDSETVFDIWSTLSLEIWLRRHWTNV